MPPQLTDRQAFKSETLPSVAFAFAVHLDRGSITTTNCPRQLRRKARTRSTGVDRLSYRGKLSLICG